MEIEWKLKKKQNKKNKDIQWSEGQEVRVCVCEHKGSMKGRKKKKKKL